MERKLLTTGAINIEDRCADKARISLEQAQWLSILSERFEKARCLFSGELDHAHFCDHNRPAKNRADGESQQHDLPRDGGVLKSEQESAAREQFREQNQRQVELISNAFSEKRKGVELGRAVDRPTNLSSRATVEGSRRESFKVTSSGSLDLHSG